MHSTARDEVRSVVRKEERCWVVFGKGPGTAVCCQTTYQMTGAVWRRRWVMLDVVLTL